MSILPVDVEYDETAADRRRNIIKSGGKGRFSMIAANKKVLLIAACAS